jgi:NADP-dependent 3-hydroxy acid dehydrogenase YdfG
MAADMKDKVVVITGASSGIGRATAHAFAKRGASLVLAARSGEALDEVERECAELGVRASACRRTSARTTRSRSWRPTRCATSAASTCG